MTTSSINVFYAYNESLDDKIGFVHAFKVKSTTLEGDYASACIDLYGITAIFKDTSASFQFSFFVAVYGKSYAGEHFAKGLTFTAMMFFHSITPFKFMNKRIILFLM